MKTIVLHGPGEVGKRAELLRIKKQYSDSVTIDFKQASLEQLKSVILSRPFFETGERLIIVENTLDKLDLSSLSSQDNNLTVIFLAGQPRSDSLLLQSAKKKGAKILIFEGEKELSVFPYLDALLERRPQTLKELDKLLAEYSGVYVLTMIYYGLRRNILPLPASSFLRQKITGQKKRFRDDDWPKLYRMVLEADFNTKNGVSEEKLELTLLTQKLVRGEF